MYRSYFCIHPASLCLLVAAFNPFTVRVICDPMDCSLPGCSVHGISQARILEWVAISFSSDLPDPVIKTMSPALTGGFFTAESLGKPYVY